MSVPMTHTGPEIHVSFVAPAFNEADNLPRLVEEVAAAAAVIGQPWEFVIANDSSTDGSDDVLRGLMAQTPQLRVIEVHPRSGQSAALEAGLAAAHGRFIATMDADLQNDPAEIPRLLAMLVADECDMVNGWRKDRRDPLLRRITTKGGNFARNFLTRESIRDSGCGLKVYRREVARKWKLFNGMHRYLPTLAKMNGFRVLEVPVHHRPRTAGKAKYGFWNRFFKVLRDAVAVRWMQSRNLAYETTEWDRPQARSAGDSDPKSEMSRTY